MKMCIKFDNVVVLECLNPLLLLVLQQKGAMGIWHEIHVRVNTS